MPRLVRPTGRSSPGRASHDRELDGWTIGDERFSSAYGFEPLFGFEGPVELRVETLSARQTRQARVIRTGSGPDLQSEVQRFVPTVVERKAEIQDFDEIEERRVSPECEPFLRSAKSPVGVAVDRSLEVSERPNAVVEQVF